MTKAVHLKYTLRSLGDCLESEHAHFRPKIGAKQFNYMADFPSDMMSAAGYAKHLSTGEKA